MQAVIHKIYQVRTYLLQQIDPLNIQQLNQIPDGFSNNIIWNLGHLVAAQQGLCYLRAGVPAKIDDGFFQRYKPGSVPNQPVTSEAVDHIHSLLLHSMDTLVADHTAGLFAQYNSFTTRYGVTIQNVEDAMDFVLFHEGLHAGYIMALKRLV